MNSSEANDVLRGISRNVRQVVRMMTNSYNKEACLAKVDTCLAHVNSLKGALDDAQVDPVECSVRAN